MKEPQSVPLTAADGQTQFVLSSQMFDATEDVFFQREHLARGIAECISRGGGSVGESVVLTGKNSLFPGLAERLRMELRVLGVSLAVVAPPNRETLAFSNVAMHFAGCEQNYISLERYNMVGPQEIAEYFVTTPMS